MPTKTLFLTGVLCFGILEEIYQSIEDTHLLSSSLKVWELHMFQKEKGNIGKVHPFHLVPVCIFVMECHGSLLNDGNRSH